jgi:hypothetical protein
VLPVLWRSHLNDAKVLVYDSASVDSWGFCNFESVPFSFFWCQYSARERFRGLQRIYMPPERVSGIDADFIANVCKWIPGSSVRLGGKPDRLAIRDEQFVEVLTGGRVQQNESFFVTETQK